MDLYPFLIFLHVLGAVGIFAATGIEVATHQRLRRADTVERALSETGILERPPAAAHLGMVAVLVTGIWMMVTRWGPEPWMVTALIGIAVNIGLFLTFTRSALRRLEAALSEVPRQPGHGWREPLHEPALELSLWLRVAVLVGIVGLMTLKPALWGSVILMATAIVAGLIAGLRTGPPPASKRWSPRPADRSAGSDARATTDESRGGTERELR